MSNQTPQANILQVPMPSPRASGAPRFEGKEVTSFLTSIVQHGASAGITDIDDLVPYILQYSTGSIRSLIRYMPEFDPEVTAHLAPASPASSQHLAPLPRFIAAVAPPLAAIKSAASAVPPVSCCLRRLVSPGVDPPAPSRLSLAHLRLLLWPLLLRPFPLPSPRLVTTLKPAANACLPASSSSPLSLATPLLWLLTRQ
ncbi:hypothetical protein B0H10DRAFT_2235683 [Mycena sp. CBHHK59/15]|nr:hypothetical protein B0H10DRAFT_2235683 [Mycena sp. CBHHK59/15]